MKQPFLKISKQNTLQLVVIFLYLIFIYLCAPICFAFFLSSIIAPIITKFAQKMHIHYHLLIALFSIALLFLFAGSLYIILTYGEQLLLSGFHQLRDFLTTFENIPFISYAIAPLQQTLIQLISQIAASFQLMIHYIFDLLLFLIAFYFSLVEARKKRYWYFIYVPSAYRQKWQQFFHDALQMFVRYFTIEVRLVAVTMLVLSIGFSMLQFDHPIIKAVLLALLDCIPFFGISLVLVPFAIYFMAIGSYSTALGIFILLVVTIIVRQLLDTYLWAATVKIKTIHTFFISGVSFMIFGFYGIIVSPILLLLVMKFKMNYERF